MPFTSKIGLALALGTLLAPSAAFAAGFNVDPTSAPTTDVDVTVTCDDTYGFVDFNPSNVAYNAANNGCTVEGPYNLLTDDGQTDTGTYRYLLVDSADINADDCTLPAADYATCLASTAYKGEEIDLIIGAPAPTPPMITLPDPLSMIASITPWSSSLFDTLLPLGLLAIGLVIGGMVVRYIVKNVKGSVRKVTGGPRGTRRVRHYAIRNHANGRSTYFEETGGHFR